MSLINKTRFGLLEPLRGGYHTPRTPRLVPLARWRRLSGGLGGGSPPERPLAPEAPAGGVRGG
eukprot:8916152-Alexandrium_andersonii.AAC.1